MAALHKRHISGQYIPLEIAPGQFTVVMRSIRNLPFRGFNVTVPYKERVIPFLDSLSPEARRVGAVNTVIVGKKLRGDNTDVFGFTCALRTDLHFRAKGKRALLIGAGGAARACIVGLAREGVAMITVSDYIAAKACALVKHFARVYPGITFCVIPADPQHYKETLATTDLLINASPCGLRREDPLPVPAAAFPAKRLYIFDLVYNPAVTALQRLARRKGYRSINGLSMLLYQGARAFELWTGRKAPLADMRRALQRSLAQAAHR